MRDVELLMKKPSEAERLEAFANKIRAIPKDKIHLNVLECAELFVKYGNFSKYETDALIALYGTAILAGDKFEISIPKCRSSRGATASAMSCYDFESIKSSLYEREYDMVVMDSISEI